MSNPAPGMHTPVNAGVKRVALSAVVHRACAKCGAANPQGLPACPACGNPKMRHDQLGQIAYWHRNPLKRWWWKARLAWRAARQVPER